MGARARHRMMNRKARPRDAVAETWAGYAVAVGGVVGMSAAIASHVQEQAVLDEVVKQVGDVAPMAAVAVLRPDERGGWQVAASKAQTSPRPDFDGEAGRLARLCYSRGLAIGWEGAPSP